MKNSFYIFLCLALFNPCSNNLEKCIAKDAMVVSARKEASEIGLMMMKMGGNAFDAMIATELALAVVYPSAGNLGGGGFMVYRLNDGSVGSLDYREKAPIKATENMFLNEKNEIIPKSSTYGALSIGIPGTVAGIFSVHEKFGSLPIEEIFKPVILLAERGYEINDQQSKRFKRHLNEIKKINKINSIYSKEYKAGDTIKNIQLANLLSRIMLNGPDEFYKGESSKKLVKFLKSNGSIISADDLEKYNAVWRTPIIFQYDDLKIISMPPPSSGGICINQIMKIIEPYDLNELGHNSTDYIKLLVESFKRSYADRAKFLGDPDFNEIPYNKITDYNYLKKKMELFSFEKPTPVNEIYSINLDLNESMETTHYSIIDPLGNSVSATTTLNSSFGSKLFCDELGIFLNNQMDDFAIKPGYPNIYGLIGGKINKIKAEKRMLSSMSPTIIEKNNNFYMALGTPGGSTIITSVIQTILNVHEFNMNMEESVNSPRFHHQLFPDLIKIEKEKFNDTVLVELENDGYNLEFVNPYGRVDGILALDCGCLDGGSDNRGNDYAIGF
ncbi:MAG: gamma-glutamyltransferase [Flavobacteriaceae bacterium]